MTDIKPKKTRKTKATHLPEASADLLVALRWIAAAQKSQSALPYQTHCVIEGGLIQAFDGAIGAGHKVSVDWTATPRTDRLTAALAKATDGLQMVVEVDQIMVKAGRLSVRVPCIASQAVAPILADPIAVTADDRFLEQMVRVLPVAKEGASTVLEASILIEGGCVSSCDRKLVLQAYHGIQTPKMVVPAAFASIVTKKKGLTGIGASDSTMTFWFGDDKWLRTNLYDPSEWPDINRLFPSTDNPLNIDNVDLEAVHALIDQSDNGIVKLTTEGYSTETAMYEVMIAVNKSLEFELFLLEIVMRSAQTIDWDCEGKAIFYGEDIRGALIHVGN